MKQTKFKITVPATSTLAAFKLELEPTINDGQTVTIIQAVEVRFDEASLQATIGNGANVIRLTDREIENTNAFPLLGEDTREYFREGHNIYNVVKVDEAGITPVNTSGLILPTRLTDEQIEFTSTKQTHHAQVLVGNPPYEAPFVVYLTIWYDLKKIKDIDYLRLQNACACTPQVSEYKNAEFYGGTL